MFGRFVQLPRHTTDFDFSLRENHARRSVKNGKRTRRDVIHLKAQITCAPLLRKGRLEELIQGRRRMKRGLTGFPNGGLQLPVRAA